MDNKTKTAADVLVEMNDDIKNNPMLELIIKLILLRRRKRNIPDDEELTASEKKILFAEDDTQSNSSPTPPIVTLETNETNFGHNNIIWKGVSLPIFDDYEKKLKEMYENSNNNVSQIELTSSSSQKGGNSNYVDYINNLPREKQEILYDLIKNNQQIRKNIIFEAFNNGNLKPLNDDNIFKLYRCGIGKLNKPISTEEPVLVTSLFIGELFKDKISVDWINKYLYANLCQIISYNNYFPNSGIRVYFDWYTLEYLKNFTAEQLPIEELHIKKPSFYYEDIDINNDVNKSYKHFDNFIKRQISKINFKNAYEKFIYYFFMASKIYNSTDSDEKILQNKHADFFIYKFGDEFTEMFNGFKYHITQGYIGQVVRFIFLKQENYMYNGEIIKRNKHYLTRDAHSCQTAYNDSLIIKAANNYSKETQNKIYNILAADIFYSPPWHPVLKCPADNKKVYKRSSAIGITQFINFTDNSKWLEDVDYVSTIGMTFLLDNSNIVTFKNSREPFISGTEPNLILKKHYSYGIDEVVMATLFVNDFFKDRNIYEPIKYDFIAQLPNENDDSTPIKKASFLLYNYVKDNLQENFSFYDFIKQIEELRNQNINDNTKKKWLSYLLSLYPNKYFIFSTAFAAANSFLNGQYDPKEKKYNKVNINNLVNSLKGSIYTKNIGEYTWELFEEIELNCLTPLIMSSLEWCIQPYLEMKDKCSDSIIVSGFYKDSIDVEKTGIFRTPEELGTIINYIDKIITQKEKVPLYKNIIENKTTAEYFRGGNNDKYYQKYLKYKNKYLSLKN
jgi:hypothetical protein